MNPKPDERVYLLTLKSAQFFIEFASTTLDPSTTSQHMHSVLLRSFRMLRVSLVARQVSGVDSAADDRSVKTQSAAMT